MEHQNNEVQVEQPEETENPDYMDRRLATISTISELTPIKGADRIVLAGFTTHAYRCVVGKGEFNVSDRCVYYAIDSFLKPNPAYDSVLSKNCSKTLNGQPGYRIKTITLRGQLSQGFATPVPPEMENLPDGTDVTEQLGVKKWIYPVGYKIGKVIGEFPAGIPKTDQTNVQALDTYHLIRLLEHTFTVTEKLDGTSCTVYGMLKAPPPAEPSEDSWLMDNIHVGVCTRNLELAEPCPETKEFCQPLKDSDEARPGDVIHGGKLCRKIVKIINSDSTYWDVVNRYGLPAALRQWCARNKRQIAVQGEICGPGVQKNPLGLPALRFFIFDIYDIDNQCYLSIIEQLEIIDALADLRPDGCEFTPHDVPLIKPSYSLAPSAERLRLALDSAINETSDMVRPTALWERFIAILRTRTIQDLLELADGKVFTGADKPREGIVLKSENSPNISFKVLNNSALLQDD